MVNQGDVINVGGIDAPLLVISKNTYNDSGAMIVCPIVKKKPKNILNKYIETQMIKGYVVCDDMKRLNWKDRGTFNKGTISSTKLFQILDMVSAIIDYV